MEMDAIKAIEAVKEGAKAKPDPVVYKKMDVGDIHWQGDMGILRVSGVPHGAKKGENKTGQLAEGQTRGSRHIVAQQDMQKVEFFAPRDDSDPCCGPTIRTSGPVEITHPDHGHVTIPQGEYEIRYQREWVSPEEARRVAD